MARKNNRKPRARRPRLRLKLFAALFAAVILLLGWMYVNALTVHVRYADVRLSDLPPSFDGTRVLFVSDIDLCGTHTARRAGSMFDQLEALAPDLLLLGGDYASPSLIDLLNDRTGDGEAAARAALFQELADFSAPLGKYAVSGEKDGTAAALITSMQGSGVKLIDGTAEIISNGTDAIAVVGMGTQTGDVSSLTSRLPSDACILALVHSPQQVVSVQISEASGGGSWADLILAGHTHGGQIRIGERTLFSLTDVERRYRSGWYTDGTVPVLVSEGVGCEGLNLRFGTQAEVWMITLKCK